MFAHIFRLIWKRKISNLLIIVELSLAFLVLFFIAATTSHLWKTYQQPLGFDWQDRYSVMLKAGDGSRTDNMGILKNMMAAIKGRDDVDWVHVVSIPPFRNWHWSSTVAYDGQQLESRFNSMSDGGPEDLGVQLLTGRWFNEGDAGQPYRPVLINRKLAMGLFPEGVDPIGANISPPRTDELDSNPTEYRVIGTFEDFRQTGEFSEYSFYTIARFDIDKEPGLPSLVLKPSDGTTAKLEEALMHDMKTMASTWDISITPLATLRDRQIRQAVSPLIIAAIISSFLLLMVVFGLFGVLWQNVTRRTHELGLRRALGASRASIFGQITAEMLLTAALAIAVGILIAIQFPMLGTFASLNWEATISGIIISAILLLILVLLCTLYPSWMASSKLPAEALRYE